jgi:general secretion pathway protein D
MRRFSKTALVPIIAALLLSPAGAFADAVLSVSSPASVPQGSAFAVDVNVTGAADLFAFQLDLAFDPSVLSASGITEGTFLNGGDPSTTFFIPGTIDNVAGTISLNADSLLSAVSGVNGDGTLLEFDFTALAPGSSALTIQNEILQDSSLAIVNDTVSNGSVTVTASGPVPTPEPSSLIFLAISFVALATFALLKRGKILGNQII